MLAASSFSSAPSACSSSRCRAAAAAAAAPRLRPQQHLGLRTTTTVRGLKENVAPLMPGIEGIQQVTLQPLGHTIPNQEGKKASVAIYAHLAQKHGGKLTAAAAEEGLELYADVVEDAKQRPGAHPNIDILLDVLSKPDQPQLSIQVEKQ